MPHDTSEAFRRSLLVGTYTLRGVAGQLVDESRFRDRSAIVIGIIGGIHRPDWLGAPDSVSILARLIGAIVNATSALSCCCSYQARSSGGRWAAAVGAAAVGGGWGQFGTAAGVAFRPETGPAITGPYYS